ncbi:C4-dicarboxylate ABC transporter permease [Primorskyibacter flagellatus]|uniref:TRAP transporter small permease protein n=1 Tax=Primorskyibacter flagellatus TaxID=1387277 RepID=A0A917A5N1_9RHOB|nr:TRAP transporter small permease [Primorskyibacter flagellatus]GGE28807.1 C4-dicarboxylate ABC transporter permease [Primorskyibacter flagellatus]
MQTGQGSGVIDRIEETAIAFILGLMTLITFANVVARYVFNSNILWALEATVFLFAWMSLLGAAYAVKKGAHLGVDAIIALLPATARRIVGLVAVAVCVIFSFLLLKGAWDYWANFANLPQTEGRWFPLGFEEKFRPKAWYEVNDINMPDFLRFIEPLMNDGDKYEKMPRFIPYAILPFTMALLLYRFVMAGVRIWTGKSDRIVASHEVEDELAEVQAARGEN